MEKIDLGFSVDVASLKAANSLIQSVTHSISDWISKIQELDSESVVLDKNLKKTFNQSGKNYEELGKKTGNYLKNKKKLDDYTKSLKSSGLEYTKYNKRLKDSSKSLTDFSKIGTFVSKITQKNNSNMVSSLKNSNKELQDFDGFSSLTGDLNTLGKEQEDVFSNLQMSLESVTAQSAETNSSLEGTVMTLAGLGQEVIETEKKSSRFTEVFKSGFEKISNTASGVRQKVSGLSSGMISAAGNVGSAFKGITGKLNELQGTLKQGFSTVSQKIKDSAFSIGNLFPPLAALGGAAGGILTIKGAFESAWNAGQELEKMTVKMTNRFGSSDYAKKATGFINDMSQEYGLAKDELTNYATELGEMGLSVDKVNFKGVLNAANGPGKDLQSTMSAMTALAKGGDFQSFTEAFGNTIDPTALQESLAGATTYQERMQKTADFLDTQFAGNADRMKNSTEGQINSISGFFEKIQQTIAGSGAFRAMQDVLTNIFNTIEANKENILAVAQVIGSMMGTVIKFIGGLLGNVSGSMGGATNFFKSMVGKIRDIFYPIMFILAFIGMKIKSMIAKLFRGDLAGGVTDFGDIISRLIDGITGIVGKVFDIVTNLFKWFNAQLPKLIPAVVGAFSKIMDSIVGFAKMVGTKVAALFPELLKTLGGLVKMIVPMLKKLLLSVIEIIIDWTPKLASMLWQSLVWVAEQLSYIGPELGKMLSEGIGMLGKWISDWIGNLANDLLKSDNPFLKWLGNIVLNFKASWDSIIAMLQGAFEVAGNIIGKIGDFFSSLFSGDFMDAGGKIYDIFNELGNFISGVFANAIDSILGFFTSLFDDIAKSLLESDNVFLNFLGGVVKVFSDIINFIKNIFGGVFDFIGGIFSDVGSLVGNVFGNIFDMFKNLFSGDFSGAWENIKNIFDSLWTFVKSVFGRILKLIMDVFTSIFTFIWDTLKNVFNTFVTMFGNILSYIGRWIGDAWSAFTNFLSSLPGKFVDAFNYVKDAVFNVLSGIPDAIMGFIGSIPEKIGALLSGGFKGMLNIGESIFGEGFFDPLIRMFKKFMNFVIKGINNIPGIDIPLLYDDSSLQDQAKEMAGKVGAILASPTEDRNLQPMISRIHKEAQNLIGEQGAQAGSAMAQVFERFDKRLSELNSAIGNPKTNEKERKAYLDEVVNITASIQNLAKSTFSKVDPLTEKDSKKTIQELIGWVAASTKEAYTDSLAGLQGIITSKTNPIKDGLLVDGQVTPMDPKDNAFVTKSPGVVESLAKGDFASAASAAGKKFVGSALSVGGSIKDAFYNAMENVKGMVGLGNLSSSDLINNVVSVAKLFLGQKEKDKIVDGKIVGNLGFQSKEMTDFMALSGYKGASEAGAKEGLAWCAAFVKSAYASVFQHVPEIWNNVKSQFQFGAVNTLNNLTKAGGLFERSNENPVAGSLMAWGNATKGHLGMVTEVLGKTVKAIEGNTGKDGQGREGFIVSENIYKNGKYDKGSLKFAGFANPKFSEFFNGVKKGTPDNPGKDFVMRPGQEPLFFEPTDTVMGVRKTAGLESKKERIPSQTNLTINFNSGSIQLNSVNPSYDAKKILEEIETIVRRKHGRLFGMEPRLNY